MFLQKRRKKIAFCDHHLTDFKSYFFALVDSCVIICVITIIFIITITITIIIIIIIIIITMPWPRIFCVVDAPEERFLAGAS